MAWPTPKVSIAFNDGPYVASPTWTDITEYVYSANVSRGRSDDYSPFIGTAQVVLNNNSRLFDPFNTAGTYYGKLLPRRQIKIEGISNSVTYSVFRGFVDGFPAAWDQAGKFATTTLSCFDGISLLSQDLLPDYVYDHTIALSPTNYWRCNDGQASTTITDVVEGYTLSALFNVFYRLGPQVSTALASPSISTGDSQYSTTKPNRAQTNGDVTMSGWYSPTQTLTLANMGISDFAGTGSLFVGLESGRIKAFAGTVSVESNRYSTSANYSINDPAVFITVTYVKSTGVVSLYINGIAQTGSSSTAFTTGNFTPIYFAFLVRTIAQEFSIIGRAISAAEALALYNVNNNNITETSAARVTRLLAYTSWDASLQSITASPVATVGGLSTPGSNLVAEMQLVNNSENGDLFVTRAGVIKFTDRNYVYTNTTSNTSQATFAAGSIPFEPSVQINYDAAAIRNDITVTFTGGGQTSTTNTASVTAYGTNAMNIETQLSTQAQAVTLAAYEATVNGQLLTDISPLSVGVTAQTADWTTLMQLDLLDRYTLTVQPPSGNSISQTELINRIEHRIVPGQWQMTVDGSARYTAWFILDKSLLDGPDLLQ
jgi:hypothetical protein